MKTYIIEFDDDKEVDFLTLQNVIVSLQSDHRAQIKRHGSKVSLVCWAPSDQEPEEAEKVNVSK